MEAATPPTIARRAFGRLRTAAVVAALACASNGAYAAFASVLIDDFFFTATPGNDTSFLFAPTDTMGQVWDLRTFANGAQTGVATGNRADFGNVTATATGPQASATVSSSPITLPSGQVTPSFHVSATANPLGGVPYEASGLMFVFGSYCFYDAALDTAGAFDGTSAFCTGLGSVDFFIQYDLEVTQGPGFPPTTAYAELDVNATGLASVFDFASTVAGVPSKLDQQLIWTAILGTGDAATFDLTGVVVATAAPEPGVLALAALGLIGLAATRRRNARTVS